MLSLTYCYTGGMAVDLAEVNVITARAVGQAIELSCEIAAPIAHPVGSVELCGRDGGDVDELLQQALVVASCPTANDRLDFGVLPCERFEPCSGQRRRGVVHVQSRVIESR